ncbi:MAG: energy-coupling factor ABC transporter permease [Oscillospiraceae bacterium]|jgi:cobalt/nickel transport system permease protein|nr:energy-coupling factor ABC transporter permease [Oscillospiraceae bacterium]
MHMSDALLNPVVGGAMLAVSAGAIALSVRKISKEQLDEGKLPMMAVSGAFVFAAQMINFTIPGTGSSGHIGGGALLAALLGPFPALITIAAVLLIQALCFADGGLIAYGCNVFNMGVIPCLIVWPVMRRVFQKDGWSVGRLRASGALTAFAGLELGAFCVVLQTMLSGITLLPFKPFTALMLPIHAAIGLGESLVTAAVLSYVYRARPEWFADRTAGASTRSLKPVLVTLLIATVAVGGLLSLYASAYPDGLEWSIARVSDEEPEASAPSFNVAATIQETTAFMPDYGFANGADESAALGTSVSGILGAAMTALLAGGAGAAAYLTKKKRKSA